MKKIVFIIFALFVGVSYADNVITSKSYVDTAANNLQEQISANDANTVLTYTDTAGTVGEKKIYDSSAAYNEQVDSLVTAGAFNTAIQNALETEFVCIDWLGDVHDNAHCLLYQIRAASQKQSPNLLCTPASIKYATFDPATGIFTNTAAETNNYTNFMVQLYQALGSVHYTISTILATAIKRPQKLRTTFTTTEDTHYLYIKHNDSQFDIGIHFPVEPSTTYTLLVNAIETDPSVVDGMKLQLMLVQGEYDSDVFIPCGNIYMPSGN